MQCIKEQYTELVKPYLILVDRTDLAWNVIATLSFTYQLNIFKPVPIYHYIAKFYQSTPFVKRDFYILYYIFTVCGSIYRL